MLDQAIRYGAILSQPEFEKSGNILEIGSGTKGIAVFVRNSVVGIDADFKDELHPAVLAIKASATALPLRDNCGERVVCSDMLEHLSKEERPGAIAELIRVTKGTLFLACPCGEEARRTDDRLMRLYHFLSAPVPDWLEEHNRKGIPDADEIQNTLKEQGVNWREMPGESCFTHFLVSLLIATRFLNNLWSSIIRDKPDLARRVAEWGAFPGVSPYRRLWIVSHSPQ
ncbi:MAG TPA: class I SAM-dependent methyltransferase [Bacteroidetes bacterium]|nr:class I SAM-dependent methyltransferase [Bacteroidota bacterium]